MIAYIQISKNVLQFEDIVLQIYFSYNYKISIYLHLIKVDN